MAVTTRYADARYRIWNGDVLLFRWRDLISDDTSEVWGPDETVTPGPSHTGRCQTASEAARSPETHRRTTF